MQEQPNKRLCEVRTINKELFLACIQTYTKDTHKTINPARLAKQNNPAEMINAVLNKNTRDLMEMRQLLQNPKYANLWGKSYTKELRRLSQGIPGTKGTDTIMFIKYNKIPLN